MLQSALICTKCTINVVKRNSKFHMTQGKLKFSSSTLKCQKSSFLVLIVIIINENAKSFDNIKDFISTVSIRPL